MAKVKALTERTIAERFQDVTDAAHLWGEVSEQTRALAKRILESALEAERLERLGAGR